MADADIPARRQLSAASRSFTSIRSHSLHLHLIQTRTSNPLLYESENSKKKESASSRNMLSWKAAFTLCTLLCLIAITLAAPAINMLGTTGGHHSTGAGREHALPEHGPSNSRSDNFDPENRSSVRHMNGIKSGTIQRSQRNVLRRRTTVCSRKVGRT
jgi:hypothetical protein